MAKNFHIKVSESQLNMRHRQYYAQNLKTASLKVLYMDGSSRRRRLALIAALSHNSFVLLFAEVRPGIILILPLFYALYRFHHFYQNRNNFKKFHLRPTHKKTKKKRGVKVHALRCSATKTKPLRIKLAHFHFEWMDMKVKSISTG